MKAGWIVSFVACCSLTWHCNGQTASEVVARYIDFTGGVKSWRAVNTMVTTGEFNYGGMPFPFTTYARSPDSYKLVVPFNGKFYAQAHVGGKGWKLDAFKNETQPTRLNGAEARLLANEADVEVESPFVNYARKGHSITLEKADSVLDRHCHVIGLTRKTGEKERYYFDQRTAELVMKEAKAKNPELGGATLNIYYSDYREVGGLMLPFRIVCEADTQTILTITVTSIDLNPMIDNSTFDSP